jgi:hypothetical protein
MDTLRSRSKGQVAMDFLLETFLALSSHIYSEPQKLKKTFVFLDKDPSHGQVPGILGHASRIPAVLLRGTYQDSQINFVLFFISLSMSLAGLSLEMYIFHFEAISLSIRISGSKRAVFTNLDSLEWPWPIDGS